MPNPLKSAAQPPIQLQTTTSSAMKIGNPDSNKVPANPAGVERADPAKAKARGADAAALAAGEASATVELASTNAAQAAAGADFDAAKVERIANAIRDGRYEVNAEAIADKLIANAQELLSRTRQR
jgi:negative regulator of flagellin synthesis FlgM